MKLGDAMKISERFSGDFLVPRPSPASSPDGPPHPLLRGTVQAAQRRAAPGCPGGCYRGCLVPATHEAPGEQDRTKQRAYAVPGHSCSLNTPSIKTLETREAPEGGLHPCDKMRQGKGGSIEKP